MKIKKLKDAAMMLLCAMLVMSVSSCHDDYDEKKTSSEPITESAGSFEIINNADGTIITGNVVKLEVGGSLHVKFIPNEKCKSIPFTLCYVLPNATSVSLEKTEADIPLNGESELEVYVTYKTGEGILYESRRSIHIDYISTDEAAGTFTLSNPNSGKELVATFYNSIVLYVGDTIKVDFKPNDKYKDYEFTISSEQLVSIGNNQFVVPASLASAEAHTSNTSFVGDAGKPVKIIATCNETKDNVKYQLSATNECRIFAYSIPESLLVKYTLEVSAELLQFVIPTIVCANEDGSKTTSYTLKDGDWEKTEKEHIVVYSDDEGKDHYVSVTKGEKPEEGWVKTYEYDSWPPYTYVFERDYTAKNTTLVATVTYQAKDNVSVTQDSYEFYHKLDWYNKQRGVVMNVDLTDHTVRKDKVLEYIDNLVGKADEIKLFIDRTGKIEQIYK